MKTFTSLFIILFLSFKSTLYASSCPKNLILGYDDWPPYQFLDKKKTPTGLDVDIITTVLKKMKCSYSLRMISWKAHVSKLKKGKFHLAGGASKNDERKKFAYFSDSYRTESAIMLVQRNDSTKFKDAKSLKDLSTIKSFKLAINRGNWYGDIFEKLKKEKTFKNILTETTKEVQLYKMLKKGRVTGILVDKFSGYSFLKKLNYNQSIVPHPIKVYSDNIFVMFSKKSVKKSFVDRFNLNLKKIKDNGEYKKIIDHYIN